MDPPAATCNIGGTVAHSASLFKLSQSCMSLFNPLSTAITVDVSLKTMKIRPLERFRGSMGG